MSNSLQAASTKVITAWRFLHAHAGRKSASYWYLRTELEGSNNVGIFLVESCPHEDVPGRPLRASATFLGWVSDEEQARRSALNRAQIVLGRDIKEMTSFSDNKKDSLPPQHVIDCFVGEETWRSVFGSFGISVLKEPKHDDVVDAVNVFRRARKW